ncbi:tyrosine-type recombinase/integrase [Chitinimonas naiadis]
MPLTDVKIRQAKPLEKQFKLADANGLYLLVKPNGAKLWRYKYRIDGKENVYALGDYPTLSLLDARKARDDARELVKAGTNPAHHRQATLVDQLVKNANTFQAVADEWMIKNKDHWTPHYHDQVKAALEANVYPKVGKLPVRSVTASHLLAVMKKMEDRGAKTFSLQVRQWCSAIFRYAVVTQRADTDPASALKGAVKRPEVNHAKPMTPTDISDFKARILSYGGNRTTVIALWMILYAFTRTIELRKARWVDFDLENGLWTIPAAMMKKRRIHIVPLASQVVALLRELKQITGSNVHLFPNNKDPKTVMSATTINRAIEYMGYAPSTWTGHDFRATGSTRLREMGFDGDHIEVQLAHLEKDMTKRAYNHAVFLPQRVELMQAWADYIDSLPAQKITPPVDVVGHSTNPAG